MQSARVNLVGIALLIWVFCTLHTQAQSPPESAQNSETARPETARPETARPGTPGTESSQGIALYLGTQGRFPGLGVGEIRVAAGQIASDATIRLIVREKHNRILYPAIEIVSVEPEPLPPQRSADNNARRVGEGAILKRLRGAIQRVREHIDPLEHVRVSLQGQSP